MKKKYIALIGMLCTVSIFMCRTMPENMPQNVVDSRFSESSQVLLVLSPEEEFGDMADYLAEEAQQSKSQPEIKTTATYREMFERVGAYVLDVFLDAQTGIKKRYLLWRQYIKNVLCKV